MSPEPVKKTAIMPLSDLRARGLLWYINRVAFHPRGFALALDVNDAGDVTGWQLWGNGDEPWAFVDVGEDDLFRALEALLAEVRA